MALTKIKTSGIADNAITNAKMADDAIDSADFVDGSIDNAHLADDAVNSDEIAAGAIDLAHMSVNSIDSDQYVDGSIDNVHLATGIDAVKLADGTVTNTEFQYINTLSSNAQTQISAALPKAGGTMTGEVIINYATPKLVMIDSDASGTPIAQLNASDGHLVLDADRDDEISSSTLKLRVDNRDVLTLDTSKNATFDGNLIIDGSSSRSIEFYDSSEREGAIVFDETTDGFIFKVGGTGGSLTDAMKIDTAGKTLIKDNLVVGTTTVTGSDYQFSQNLIVKGGTPALILDETDADGFITMYANAGEQYLMYDHSGSFNIKHATTTGGSSGTDVLTLSGSGNATFAGEIKAPGQWELISRDVLASDAMEIINDSCFSSNDYIMFKLVVGWIGFNGSDNLYWRFRMDGSSTTGSSYYGGRDHRTHASTTQTNYAEDSRDNVILWEDPWADLSGGLHGEILVWNVTAPIVSGVDTDRGTKYRPWVESKLVGYDSSGDDAGAGYGIQHSHARFNEDFAASGIDGYRIYTVNNNLEAKSHIYVYGLRA